MSIFSSYINTLQKRYATFSGRASRREYAYFMIVLYGVNLVTSLLASRVFVSEIFFIMNIIPMFALCVRRLHDLDKSGWWLLLIIFFGNFGNFISTICLAFMAGSPKKNDYGYPPARKDNVATTRWILAALLYAKVIITM